MKTNEQKLRLALIGARQELHDYVSAEAHNEGTVDMISKIDAALAATEPDTEQSAPVAYADPMAFVNFAAGVATKEWMWAKPDTGLVSLYTHPAPASQSADQVRDALEEVVGNTGNADADRIINRLMSSDPEFGDCTKAAAMIQRLVADAKGPDGFPTWKDAAISERVRRVSAENCCTHGIHLDNACGACVPPRGTTVALKSAAPESAEPSAAIWKAITAPGQVKVGDKLRFNIGSEKFSETAKLIINKGRPDEEIIYNKMRNFYLITSMCIKGTGQSKNVEFLATSSAAKGAA